jgi:Luciferase-like monooxygenase
MVTPQDEEQQMRYGLSIPNFGEWADPRQMVQLAKEAEASGWDGFFSWDHLRFSAKPLPVHDPWVVLSAVASATERIRIGPMVTPLPRRRPWKVAREAVSLDHLSGGRLILGVGLGEPLDVEFEAFGEPTDRRVQAEMLDEALAILDGLWSGEEFSFSGTHYQLAPMRYLPRPVQRPRIPIVVAGYWPYRRPMDRAARWDGMYPLFPETMAALERSEKLGELIAYLRSQQTGDRPFEIFDGGVTPDEGDPAESARLGATWWIESLNPWRFGWDESERWPQIDPVRERIRHGPPRSP